MPDNACATCIQQTSFQHESVKNVLVLVAVVAAHGGDELLHAMLGAAVAGGTRLVHQRGVLLAWPHAHAGAPPAAFHPHTRDNMSKGDCCCMQQNLLSQILERLLALFC